MSLRGCILKAMIAAAVEPPSPARAAWHHVPQYRRWVPWTALGVCLAALLSPGLIANSVVASGASSQPTVPLELGPVTVPGQQCTVDVEMMAPIALQCDGVSISADIFTPEDDYATVLRRMVRGWAYSPVPEESEVLHLGETLTYTNAYDQVIGLSTPGPGQYQDEIVVMIINWRGASYGTYRSLVEDILDAFEISDPDVATALTESPNSVRSRQVEVERL